MLHGCLLVKLGKSLTIDVGSLFNPVIPENRFAAVRNSCYDVRITNCLFCGFVGHAAVFSRKCVRSGAGTVPHTDLLRGDNADKFGFMEEWL